MHELISFKREYAARKEKVEFANQFKKYKILSGDQ